MGVLGLSTLSQPSPSPLVVAGIIFIHDLGGGGRKTWSYSDDLNLLWLTAVRVPVNLLCPAML